MVSAADPTQPDDPTKAWIEIVLKDPTGQPMPGERYALRLPDGATLEGALDAQGFARFEQIAPGDCQVSFPRIDRRMWRPQ